MRYALFVMLFLFVGCSSSKEIAVKPSWYFQQVSEKNEIIGYGEASSCSEAKSEARDDIAKQLMVSVESEMEVTQDSDANYYAKNKLQESVEKITLRGVGLAHKPEQVGDRCYVAMRYSLEPLLFKVALIAQNEEVEEMRRSSLLAHSIFAKQLESKLGYIPKFTLTFIGSQPSLHIAQENILLTQIEMRLMVFEKYSKSISLAVDPSETLHVNDKYFLRLEVKHADYLSVIYIDENYNARVGIKNQYVEQEKSLEYPEKSALMAGISSTEQQVKEMYVALLCEEPLNLSPFSRLDEQANVDKDALKLSELFILAEACESTSVVITVEK